MKHREGFREPYRLHRARIVEEMLAFAAAFYEVGEISEASTFEALKQTPHSTILFMLEVEERFGFDFPDNLTNKRGRLKQCRADTLRTIRELVTYIARLPGNTPK